MSLNDAANYLKLHGRGNDTELVHMSKDEVNSLRHLAQSHGGDLSVNPHTGLKEAGFLDSILPMVIGGATAVFAPEALPYVVGGVGLGTYAKTGSLTKGVMAGLGAYGGSSLAAGVSALGAQTAGSEMAVNGMDLASDQVTKAAAPSILDGAGQSASNFTSGLGSAISDPSALASQMGGWGSLAKYGAMAAAPALSSALSGSSAPTPNSATITPYTYARNPVDPSTLNLTGANYVKGQNPDTSERTYFHPQYTALTPYTYTSADGGQVPPPSSFNNINAPMSHNTNTSYANYSAMPMPQNPMSSGATLMADGGRAMTGDGQPIDPTTGMLGDYSDGGRLLKGPGDGVSDSIPATIAGKQPARLADGEFVVPARIVSELGNGSTEAGARKLYSMLDRIQHARRESIGKNNVAKNSKADRYLPA